MPDVHCRNEAESAAREMLRDVIGHDLSDTMVRAAADHLLAFREQMRPSRVQADEALSRLINSPPATPDSRHGSPAF